MLIISATLTDPAVLNNISVNYLEGTEDFSVNLLNIAAVPSVSTFQWTQNGTLVRNNSNRSFGYPEVTVNSLYRVDDELYVLRATNYFPNNATEAVGTAQGSLHLNVLCKENLITVM